MSGIINDPFNFFPSLFLLVNPVGTKSGPTDLVPTIHTPDICQMFDILCQILNIKKKYQIGPHQTWLVDCQTLLRWSGLPLAITLLLNLDRRSG